MTHYVYTAWDANQRPLYVGCTNDVTRRMRGHRYTSAWYRQHASVTVMEFPTEAEALAIERRQIQKLRPGGNIRHNPSYQTVGDAIANELAWREYDEASA
jgi:predicted GIY-YIG superfamily endonuclease